MHYKKILIVTAGRINCADTTNNGLLFRNLFRSWPKDRIAQVFNSGSNSDEGFFSSYYQLGVNDRRFGYLYSRLHQESFPSSEPKNKQPKQENLFHKLIPYFRSLFIETGIYELFFRPKLSEELKQWLNFFKPELVLVQGYSITFTELPLLIKKYTGAKLVFFTTDDWPKYLYNGNKGEFKFLSLLPRYRLNQIVNKLRHEVEIQIDYGHPMQDEYSKRYKKHFESVIHSDDYLRFLEAVPIRLNDTNSFSILTIGTFNKFRWPLLQDFDDCCGELEMANIKTKISVISDSIAPEGIEAIAKMKHIEVYRDPGSPKMPALLKGADLLVLIEGFDHDFAESIKLSISTKAHLYMFSKVPILVYSHPITGIVNYAKKYNWAYVLTERNTAMLKNVLKQLLLDNLLRTQLIENAFNVALENHDINKIEEKLFKILQ